MNKYLIAAIMCLISYSGFCQAKEREKTAMEIFGEKSGRLTKKEFFEVGKVGKVSKIKVEYLIVSDLNDNSKVTGARLEYDSYSSISGSDTKVAFIDKDELSALIASLTYMQEKVFTSSPSTYTEITYTSKAGMSASSYQNLKGGWSCVVKLEKYDSRSSVVLNPEEVGQLTELLKSAQSKLNNIQ